MVVDETFTELLVLSSVIALGFLFAVAFYESLSTRDVLVRRTTRIARWIWSRRWFVGIVYLLTVGVGIPFLVVAWTVILELALTFVSSSDRLGNVALVAVAVVGAARILAYVRQKTSHELAKAVPLAFAFVLLTGGSVDWEDRILELTERQDIVGLSEEMILFLIGLEVGLRLLTDTSHAVLSWIRRRRGIDSDLGVWRTLAAAVRRPVAAAVPVEPGPAGPQG
jgi:hypothetical protein